MPINAIEADLSARKAEADNHHGRLIELRGMHLKVIDDYQRMSVWEAETRASLKALQEDADQTRHSLHAIYSRERLKERAVKIEQEASELYDGFHAGECYGLEAWAQWEAALIRWESALSDWIEDAQWYSYDVRSRITSIDDRQYAAKWTVKDSQFPESEGLSRSEAVRRFKKSRIMHEQWHAVRADVENGVVQVAYVGLTSKEVTLRPQ